MLAYLMPVIKQLLIEGVMSSRSPILPKVSAAGISLMGLSGALAIIGIAFVMVSEYFWLKAMYMPDMAALFTAGTAVFLSLFFGLIGMAIMKQGKDRHAVHTPPQDIAKTIGALVDSLGEELEQPIRENPKTAVMLASLAGFVAGDRSH
jgi:hypothetical protein